MKIRAFAWLAGVAGHSRSPSAQPAVSVRGAEPVVVRTSSNRAAMPPLVSRQRAAQAQARREPSLNQFSSHTKAIYDLACLSHKKMVALLQNPHATREMKKEAISVYESAKEAYNTARLFSFCSLSAPDRQTAMNLHIAMAVSAKDRLTDIQCQGNTRAICALVNLSYSKMDAIQNDRHATDQMKKEARSAYASAYSAYHMAACLRSHPSLSLDKRHDVINVRMASAESAKCKLNEIFCQRDVLVYQQGRNNNAARAKKSAGQIKSKAELLVNVEASVARHCSSKDGLRQAVSQAVKCNADADELIANFKNRPLHEVSSGLDALERRIGQNMQEVKKMLLDDCMNMAVEISRGGAGSSRGDSPGESLVKRANDAALQEGDNMAGQIAELRDCHRSLNKYLSSRPASHTSR